MDPVKTQGVEAQVCPKTILKNNVLRHKFAPGPYQNTRCWGTIMPKDHINKYKVLRHKCAPGPFKNTTL